MDENYRGTNQNCKPKHKPASHPNRRTRLENKSKLQAEAQTGQPPGPVSADMHGWQQGAGANANAVHVGPLSSGLRNAFL